MKSKSNSPSFPSPGAIFFGLCACVAFVFLLVALAQNSGQPVKVDIVSLSSEEYQGSVVFTALVEIQSSEDVYIPNSLTGTGTPVELEPGFAYDFIRHGEPAGRNHTISHETWISSGAEKVSDRFRLQQGQKERFTLKVKVVPKGISKNILFQIVLRKIFYSSTPEGELIEVILPDLEEFESSVIVLR